MIACRVRLSTMILNNILSLWTFTMFILYSMRGPIDCFEVCDVLIDLVTSFHCDMNTRVMVDDTLLEEIEVCNVLHHSCTMAPILTPV